MPADALEARLAGDVAGLGDRLLDDNFCADLYRALAGRRWTRAGDQGAVAPSWSRAEQIVNGARERAGREPLVLAQTGGEGRLAHTVEQELGGLGWSSEPRDTSERDDVHAPQPAPGAPPGDAGERQAPVEPPAEWRGAHEEAAERAGRPAPPDRSSEPTGRPPPPGAGSR